MADLVHPFGEWIVLTTENDMEESEIVPVSAMQAFNFHCGPDVTCFNACCRNLNQYLSPYDVLRLKKNLGVSSSVFIEHYTLRHDGPTSGLPMVTLRPADDAELLCPFVTPDGCRVYDDRPASCRMYPVMRMAGRDRATGRIREEFMLIYEPHCGGFATDRRITVNQWMDEQGLLPYNAANDAFLQILGAKQHHYPGVLPKHLSDTVFTALYDSDRFIESIKAAPSERDLPLAGDGDDAFRLQAAYDYVLTCLAPAG